MTFFFSEVLVVVVIIIIFETNWKSGWELRERERERCTCLYTTIALVMSNTVLVGMAYNPSSSPSSLEVLLLLFFQVWTLLVTKLYFTNTLKRGRKGNREKEIKRESFSLSLMETTYLLRVYFHLLHLHTHTHSLTHTYTLTYTTTISPRLHLHPSLPLQLSFHRCLNVSRKLYTA